MCQHHPIRCILPPYILHAVAAAGDDALRASALGTLALDHKFRLARAETAARSGARLAPAVTFGVIGGQPNRAVYNQSNQQLQTPGAVGRAEGQPPSTDPAINQAYDGLGATYSFYWSLFQRNSLNGAGAPLLGLVHFGTGYDNAFWDGAGHMFFGDGDGRMLTETTAGLDVIGHELTHGVTQFESALSYSGQAGALNESISDVFGIMIKQWQLGQDAAHSDWLIGADVVGPELAPALRSMKAPGTANKYDNQPSTMDEYVEGGDVHVNSGIPNRAFYLAASALEGNAWDAAGPIWYAACTDPRLHSDALFTDFARLTLANAQQKYGAQSAQANAVTQAWETVKVPLSP